MGTFVTKTKKSRNLGKFTVPLVAASIFALGISCGRLSPSSLMSSSSNSDSATQNSGGKNIKMGLSLKQQNSAALRLGLADSQQAVLPQLVSAVWDLHNCVDGASHSLPGQIVSVSGADISNGVMNKTLLFSNVVGTNKCIFSLDSFQLSIPGESSPVTYQAGVGAASDLFGDGTQSASQSLSPYKEGKFYAVPARSDNLNSVSLYAIYQVPNDLSATTAQYEIAYSMQGIGASASSNGSITAQSGTASIIVPADLSSVAENKDGKSLDVIFDCLGTIADGGATKTCAGVDITLLGLCLYDTKLQAHSPVSLSFSQLEALTVTGANQGPCTASTYTFNAALKEVANFSFTPVNIPLYDDGGQATAFDHTHQHILIMSYVPSYVSGTTLDVSKGIAFKYWPITLPGQ